MVIRKAYKFRLRLSNATDAIPFHQFAGSCRFVWNKVLSLQMGRLDKKKRLLSYPETAALLVKWKRQFKFLKEVPSQALQQRLMDLDKAIAEGLDPANPKEFPVFKKKYKSLESFRYPQGFEISKNRIFLPKFGWIRFFKSREIEGTPKNVTVSLAGGHWFVSVQTEVEVPEPLHPSTTSVGGDFGVKRLLTLSSGIGFLSVNALGSSLKKLIIAQKKLSRQVKKSNNWKKQKRVIQKLHGTIANIRSDRLHRISNYVSKNHALVVLEDLRVKTMSATAKGTVEKPGKHVRQKSRLNRIILDQGWGELRRQIGYKQAWRGGMMLLVDPAYTSQECSVCGHVSPHNRPSRELFYCNRCGHTENADENAAKVVLRRVGHTRMACGSNGASSPSEAGTDTALSRDSAVGIPLLQ